MVFSTNQNRHLYVVKALQENNNGEPKNVGDIVVKTLPKSDGKQLYFKYMGKGGLLRTDLIDIDSVCYAKLTKHSHLERKLKKATIKLDTDAINSGTNGLVAGQDYIVRIIIKNYIASGDDSVTIKYGAVHVTSGMDATAFYKKLAESLTMNFSREVQPLLTFKAENSTGVIVTEVEQPYVVGLRAQEPVNFEILPTTVRFQGDDVIWGKVEYSEDTTVVKNGPKIADLEWFCMGERGDQYRDYAPVQAKIPVKLMVDPTKSYNVLDLHYSFSDEGVNSYKSEKDITFVIESDSNGESVTEKLNDAIEAAGITIERQADDTNH